MTVTAHPAKLSRCNLHTLKRNCRTNAEDKDSQDVVDVARSDEDGDGMEAGQLETLYGIPRHIQYTVFTLKDMRDTHQRLLALFPTQ